MQENAYRKGVLLCEKCFTPDRRGARLRLGARSISSGRRTVGTIQMRSRREKIAAKSGNTYYSHDCTPRDQEVRSGAREKRVTHHESYSKMARSCPGRAASRL